MPSRNTGILAQIIENLGALVMNPADVGLPHQMLKTLQGVKL
jgi:hypothetical protein